MRDEFGIELFQKKGEEAVQVWYKDTKILEGEEKAVKDYINQLDKKSTPNRKLFLEEATELSRIEEVMKTTGMEASVPKWIKSALEAERLLTNLLYKMRNASKSKKFIPRKEALRIAGIKLPLSRNGICVDFVNTPYLYPIKGNEKNIVKIKLTGNDRLDFKLANELAGFGKNQPAGYTWHHLDDYNVVNNTCTVQLVETSVHSKCSPHYGSVEIVRRIYPHAKLYITRKKKKFKS